MVALASGILGLLELKEDMVRWAGQVWKSRSGESNVVTSTSIASEVVEEAKVRLMRSAADTASSTVGTTAKVASDTVHDFGWKHILEALVEPIIISTILVINALVGGYQSLNASKGISALKAMQASKAVLRLHINDNDTAEEAKVQEVEVDASSLVPGDIVILSVGQKVPADIRLFSVSTSTFTVDEASLTGESDSVPKTPYIGEDIEDNHGHVMDDLDEIQEGAGSMGKHANGMLYSGTVITAGKGVGVVVRTGMSTEMGKVSCCFILTYYSF